MTKKIIKSLIFTVLLIFSTPALANTDPQWTMPDLQIDISGLKNKLAGATPTECGTDQYGNTLYCFNWIGEYISGIYKYAIGIVGILAAIVMMIGGFIWLMAGGNQQRISEAQEWIKASLTGLIIALSSYLILYQVNPDLVKFDALQIARVTPKETTTTTPAISPAKFSLPCSNTNLNKDNVIQYSNISETGLPLPSACNGNFNDALNEVVSNNTVRGVDPKIIKAIAAQESTCGANNKKSSAGACGAMQIMPSTAKSLCSSVLGITNGESDESICNKLTNNTSGSIECAAIYIVNNQSRHKFNTYDLFAGYNGGYGQTNSNGTKGPLASSSDCPGEKAYECCINPGKLYETQNYVMYAAQYYNSQ